MKLAKKYKKKGTQVLEFLQTGSSCTNFNTSAKLSALMDCMCSNKSTVISKVAVSPDLI